MNIAKASLKRFLSEGLGMLVKMFGLFYFARILGPKVIGIFFLFQALSGGIVKFSDVDISHAVAKRASEGRDLDSLFWTGLALKVIPIGVVAITVVLLSNSVNSYIGVDIADIFLMYIILVHISSLLRHTLRGELRVGETALPMFVRQVVFVGAGFGLLSMGYGVVGLVYGLLLGTLVEMVWYSYKISIGIATPSRESALSLFKFFKYSFVSSASGYIFNWTDVLIIGLMLTQVDVGIYEIPWRVTIVALLLSRTLSGAIFPQISEWEQEDVLSQVENLVGGSLAISLFLVVPAFIGVVVFGREILRLGFGTEYVAGWLVLIIVGGIRVIEAFDIVFRQSLEAINRPHLSARSEIISVGANVVMNVILIYTFGLIGAAIATISAVALRAGLNGWYLNNQLDIQFPYRRLSGILVSSGLMALVLLGTQWIVAVDSLLKLFTSIGIGAGTYVLSALFIPPLREMILDNIRRLAE